ncbi:Ig-like domain-containing protein [Isoalcanivorax beigongshangi]|uniref:Ig-like domain-containing protein n=1 Tax=Isoalcanivorax beigongshangi TaxID=3238810 RepID=A0ABV4AE61_9GAMM
MKRLLLAACIVSLTACGGGKDDVKSGYEDKIRASGQSLVYSFPLADQVEVPTPSPVVLRFTSAVTDPATANVRLLDANGQPVAASMTSVDGDRGLILTPDTPLNPLAHYTIDIPELALADGKSAARSLHFTTRGLHQGPAASVGADTFDVLRRFPDGQTLPVADLSSLRLQLSQPLDRNTVKYGDAADSTISLVDANGQLVPARVLVGDSYLTIDPVNDMVGGAQYTLKIATGSTGLKSSRGLTLPATGMGANAWSWSFTPEDTRPPASTKNPNRDRARMVQIIDDTPMDSPLTGKRVNLVPMYSVLLGTEGSANPATPQASGYLAAELAHIPEHDETTPLRIDRGSLIKASSLPIYIGGEVPAGFSSGEVYMEFLSDATGYLIENPYSTNPEAPKLVRLMMDMGISAEGDIANGSVTQTLLHIELVGTALVEDGLMTLNAVGVVQPNILGTERATAVLSFYMQGLDDQVNAPVPPVDNSAMSLVSMTIGWDDATQLDKTPFLKANEPIILNFSRTIDPDSIDGTVSLVKQENGSEIPVPVTVYADGAALVIKPESLLESPTETGTPFNYRLRVQGDIRGTLGNEWAGVVDEVINFKELVNKRQGYKLGFFGLQPNGNPVDVQKKSVYILGIYPGFPCALNTDSRNLQPAPGQQMVAGRCLGGMQPHANDDLGALAPLEADDLLPVPEMPSNRPIVVVFSKQIDEASLFDTNGAAKTFSVYEVDPVQPDVMDERVDGTVELHGDTLKFYPNTPWLEGKLYAYKLSSNGGVSTQTTNCDANQAGASLCDLDGLPLATQMLAEVSTHYKSNFQNNLPSVFNDYFIWEESAPSYTSGGPDLIQYFRGGAASKNVLQLLRLSNVVDKNKNLMNDSSPTIMSGLGGGVSYNTAILYDYAMSENSEVVWESDSSTSGLMDSAYGDTAIDPNGLKPPANSAKILSTFYGWRDLDDFSNPLLVTTGSGGATAGANVGCGFDSYPDFSVQSGPNGNCAVAGVGDGFPLKCSWAVPSECPKDKFTYLSGALFAEVTTDLAPDGSLKVLIHPGHIVTTSFQTFTKVPTAGRHNIIDSGFQVMRMRYGNDMSPIPAFISESPLGPVLKTRVNLYLDAPWLKTDVVNNKKLLAVMHHNFYSYKVTMELSGGVQFLNDGRMVIEQRNDNDIAFSLMANAPRTLVELMVPKGGTFIQYISESIK